MSRTLVVIPPSPPWWHAHKRGFAYVLCTDPFCADAPEGTEAAYWESFRKAARKACPALRDAQGGRE